MNMQEKFRVFDKSEVFEQEMMPLLNKLQEIAVDNEIDFVALTQYLSRKTEQNGVEVGISQVTAVHQGSSPTMVCAASLNTNLKTASAALLAAALMDGGHRPDDRAAMLKDGDAKELDAVKDRVESLIGHASRPGASS